MGGERERKLERQRDQWDGNRQGCGNESNGKHTTADGCVKQETDNLGRMCKTRNGQHRPDMLNTKWTPSDRHVKRQTDNVGRRFQTGKDKVGWRGQTRNG